MAHAGRRFSPCPLAVSTYRELAGQSNPQELCPYPVPMGASCSFRQNRRKKHFGRLHGRLADDSLGACWAVLPPRSCLIISSFGACPGWPAEGGRAVHACHRLLAPSRRAAGRNIDLMCVARVVRRRGRATLDDRPRISFAFSASDSAPEAALAAGLAFLATGLPLGRAGRGTRLRSPGARRAR